MPGLVPGIHALSTAIEDVVDGRAEPAMAERSAVSIDLRQRPALHRRASQIRAAARQTLSRGPDSA
jgi:hypothetical protein